MDGPRTRGRPDHELPAKLPEGPPAGFSLTSGSTPLRINVPEDTVRATGENIAGSRAKNTERAYRAAMGIWREWCRVAGVCPLPADPRTVALYITWLAQEPHEGVSTFDAMDAGPKLREAAETRPKRPGTIRVHLSAIARDHLLAGHRSPRGEAAVEVTYEGIRRRLKVRPKRKAPVLDVALPELLRFLGRGLKRRMHKALLLVGFAGALRRSELVAVDVEHLTFEEDGLKLLIPWAKTDQEGAGEFVGITFAKNPKLCPVRALKRWLSLSGITSGAVFRLVRADETIAARLSDRYVARVVQRAVRKTGRDPALYAGHSLRAGFCTSAAKAGVEPWKIRRQSRHRSLEVLGDYLREADVFKDNPGAGLL